METNAAGAAGTTEAPAGTTTTTAAAPAAAAGTTTTTAAAPAAAAAAGASADGTGGTAAAADGGAKAPETYTLTIPADATQYLDASDLKAFEKQARANGLTNEQAQAVVGAEATRLVALSTAFRTETEADPTYGGDHLAASQQAARLALDRFAPKGTAEGDAFRRDLEKSGYGNKLTVFAFLARLGKALGEDRPTGGGTGAIAPKTAAQTLYPGMSDG